MYFFQFMQKKSPVIQYPMTSGSLLSNCITQYVCSVTVSPRPIQVTASLFNVHPTFSVFDFLISNNSNYFAKHFRCSNKNVCVSSLAFNNFFQFSRYLFKLFHFFSTFWLVCWNRRRQYETKTYTKQKFCLQAKFRIFFYTRSLIWE